jgi:hypothetical protein
MYVCCLFNNIEFRANPPLYTIVQYRLMKKFEHISCAVGLPKVVVYFFFIDLGKKDRLLFQDKQFILRSQSPSTTPCPVFLSGNNCILNWKHYQLLPMLPRKNIF